MGELHITDVSFGDFFHHYLNRSGKALILLDDDARIVQCIGNCDYIFHLNAEDIINKQFQEIFKRPNGKNLTLFPHREITTFVGPHTYIFNLSNTDQLLTIYIAPVESEGEARYLCLVTLQEEGHDAAVERLIMKLSVAMEHIPASVMITDSNGKIEYVNSGYIHMTGYSPDDVYGVNLFQHLKTSMDDEMYATLVNRTDAGKLWSGDINAKRRNGKEYWESARISSLKGQDGEIANYVKIAEDITDRRGLIDSLVSSYDFIENVMNTIMPLFVCDNNSVIIMANQSFLAMTRLKAKDAVGKELSEFFNAEAYFPIDEGLDTAISTSKPVRSIETIMERGDLEALHVIVNISPVIQNGEIPSLVGTIEDVTERIKAESALRKLNRAVEQSPASVVITDIFGTIEYVNPKFTSLTGYTSEEVIGQNPRVLKSGYQDKNYYKELWDTINHGKVWRGEFQNKKKNGEVYWEFASISPLRNEDGEVTHFVAVKEDITERKAAEDALKISEEDLRRKNLAMERELEYAQIITRKFLPMEMPARSFVNIELYYKPLELVGGDFFSFHEINPEKLGVFLGDVSGHGVSAALFLSLVKFTTDRLLKENAENPKGFIETLNHELIQSMASYFLTALYGYFSKMNGNITFTFSKGGHPPPLLYRVDTKSVVTLTSKGKPVGMFDDIEYEEVTVTLSPGDKVFIYTDGITETVNRQKEMLDINGLARIIENTSHDKLKDCMKNVIKYLEVYRGTIPPEDDIILLGFEIK